MIYFLSYYFCYPSSYSFPPLFVFFVLFHMSEYERNLDIGNFKLREIVESHLLQSIFITSLLSSAVILFFTSFFLFFIMFFWIWSSFTARSINLLMTIRWNKDIGKQVPYALIYLYFSKLYLFPYTFYYPLSGLLSNPISYHLILSLSILFPILYLFHFEFFLLSFWS